MSLAVAFKEWAVICAALATGQQSVILRKGGIAEEGGEFRPEHSAFLLYPTYFHEHRCGVKPEFLPLLESAEAARPEPGTIRFSHFVRVAGVRQLIDFDEALMLDPVHAWTEEVVRQRFQYRVPGLFVLNVRVFELKSVATRAEKAEYAGCKTWVNLDSPISTDDAKSVASRSSS